MSYLIGSVEQCQAHNAEAAEIMGLSGNVTERWAHIRRHPENDVYAILKHPTAGKPPGVQEVEELPEDWFSGVLR